MNVASKKPVQRRTPGIPREDSDCHTEIHAVSTGNAHAV
jgi:hypothetical protein